MSAAASEPAIWVNARFLTQSMSGVQRVAHNVVRRLPDCRLVTPATPREIYSDLGPSRIVVHARLPYPHLWEQVALPGVVPKNAVLWSPTGAGPVRHRRHVQSIYDMSPFDTPECFHWAYASWYRALLPVVARRARLIVTDSRAMKERIVDLLHLPEERVVVVYLAADGKFRPQPPERTQEVLLRHGIRGPYLLALGAISPRKNFVRLLQAWERIAPRHTDVELIVVGEEGMLFSGSDTLGRLPWGARRMTGVDDELLLSLYAGAMAFVYPSLYEGFGLPVLEAMAVGTPVVTSNATSLPEVAGDAAVYVDPNETESIAAGMERVMADAALRAQLSRDGLQRVQRFGWDETARQTLDALKLAAND